MKIALVHELLTMKGGAERMLRIAADMFPEAPIYTLLYDEERLGDWFPRHRIRTSHIHKWINRIPLKAQSSRLTILAFNHHLYFSRFPRAIEAWDFSAYDLVLSFSSAFTHGIITNGSPRHLCYVHSPARYLWDRTHDVLARADTGMLGPLRRMYLSRLFHRLRVWDAESAARPDRLLAASKEVQRRIELYWRRESAVLHPPLDDVWLQPVPNPNPHFSYLIVSTLSPYKRIDIAIAACNRLHVPLKIAGTGPDEKRLRHSAGPTIAFLGFQTEEALRDLYAGARATLFPGDEDFGLVPLESMACGRPVIAYRGGGALETIMEGGTGEFFDEPVAASLAKAMERFEQKTYDPAACRAQAQKFSRSAFEEQLMQQITSLTVVQ